MTPRTNHTTSKWLGLLGLLVLYVSSLQAQYYPNLDQSNALEAIWVDSVYNAMTPEQRLGQLFMIRAHSNLGSEHIAGVERLIRNHHVGSLCFFQGTPAKQVELVNRYQALSQLPLMIAMDAEWGLNMRMKADVPGFPRQLMLGAIRKNHLIYEMGQEVARQLKRVGVHVNFAPVVDVNNNPENPVIGTRSFGEDRVNVSLKGMYYMKGMQDEGIVACAKHFPGHGDTNVDSHFDLPLIPHNRQRLDSIELYPFRAMVEQGIGSIMVGHLHVPALDNRPNYPSSLSAPTINHLLREELDFHGLTFTDGLGMEGVTKHFGGGRVEAEALLAGNDILVLPVDIRQAKAKIESYQLSGQLDERSIRLKVKRVLRAKYRMGLQSFIPISTDHIKEDLNNPTVFALQEQLVENALTLVRNDEDFVPIQRVKNVQIAALAVGAGSRPMFQQRLIDFAPVDLLRAASSLSISEQEELLKRLADEDLVIVSLHNLSNSAKGNFGLKPSVLTFLERLRQQNKVALVVFGNPYSLRNFDDFGVVLQAYNEDELTQDKAAQAVFGAIGLNGRLPITASAASPFNAGLSTSRVFRLGYSTPEQVGMNKDTLHHYIDVLANEAITSGATPGCVVLVARHGKVVFHEAYGHHTYNRRRRVKTDDIYDLASITKVAATTMALMDLVQLGQLNLDLGLGEYLPELKGTNKDRLSIREILAHQAALKPWIPFYTATLNESGSRSGEVYRSSAGGAYRVQVSQNIFMHENYVDSIWHSIDQSDLRSNNNYRYSDLGFYYLSSLVKQISGKNLDEYVRDRFYDPMGLFNIDFRPRSRFSLNRIPPSEMDNYWRKQKVHGYVHDMGAAMLGGVSGHAGLFGNAHDLAVLGQLWLQRGVYGNQVYLRSDVLREFSSRFPNASRRGLGFDMRQLDTNRKLNVSELASPKVFGHLGFTGTCIWVDPAEELVYVFLSNRTYPSMNNNKLGRMNFRPKIQTAAYRAITRPVNPPPAKPLETMPLPEQIHASGT